MRYLLICLMILGGPALGQESASDWAMRGGDVLFDAEGLRARIESQTLIFYDDGQSRYETEGRYSYTYDGGNTAFGTWEILGDGSVCVDFTNGFRRCDLFVENNARLILITEAGDRYPVRP